MSKKPCFRTFFDSQHVEGSQTLLKSAWQHFYCTFSSGKLNWKMSILVISEILGLLVNTLTADDKYLLCNEENLPLSVRMQLSKKGKTVLKFFASFLKFPSHFEHFSKKDDPHFKGNIYKIFWEAYSFQSGMQLLISCIRIANL